MVAQLREEEIKVHNGCAASGSVQLCISFLIPNKLTSAV